MAKMKIESKLIRYPLTIYRIFTNGLRAYPKGVATYDFHYSNRTFWIVLVYRSYAVGPLHIVFSNPLNIRINLMCIVDYLNMLSLPLS